MRVIDVHHEGRPCVIGATVVDGAIVDPGPASGLDALLAGLGDEVPERILLTHIHLDHAGAAGTLARRWPEAEVWVHERGAPHVADPEKLLRSARRLYGDDMDRLWGPVEPVPAERLRVLSGGEAHAGWRVAYTPGHASHHVSYLHEDSGLAVCGDVAGVRIGAGPPMAPTPPPDVDVAAWGGSLDAIAAWAPSRLAVTHFGAHDDVEAQLEGTRASLARLVELSARLERDAFVARLREELNPTYEQAMPFDHLWLGLERAREVGRA